jgi:hypothetical protein
MDTQNEIQMLNDEITSLMIKSESLTGDEKKNITKSNFIKNDTIR